MACLFPEPCHGLDAFSSGLRLAKLRCRLGTRVSKSKTTSGLLQGIVEYFFELLDAKLTFLDARLPSDTTKATNFQQGIILKVNRAPRRAVLKIHFL